MLIENADYFIRYKQLPQGIYAFVTPNDDGTFSIYLDPRRSHDQQMADCSHEIWHIVNDDFYNGLPIQQVENSAELNAK